MTVSTFVEFAWKGPVLSILPRLTHSVLSTTLCDNIMNYYFTDEETEAHTRKVTGRRVHSLAQSLCSSHKLCCHKPYLICLFIVIYAL